MLKETVALSDQISQPILCFGKLMESGWNINGVQQTLTHGDIAVPIEMQNRSMTVRGWIRMVKQEPAIIGTLDVRAVCADVFGALADLRVGWHLDPEGLGNWKTLCQLPPRPNTCLSNDGWQEIQDNHHSGQWSMACC